nr:MAG TPA: hypothetical protein [Caudoviricetes sp.]
MEKAKAAKATAELRKRPLHQARWRGLFFDNFL